MIKLGVIGTNWISTQFVEAALASGNYELTAVYSRKLATAEAFAIGHEKVALFDELEAFFASKEFEVIYIASPNSLHYEQAKAAMLHGKHVIIEKPAVSKALEFKELVAVAEKQNCFMFEAARNIHEESFKEVTKLLPSHDDIIGANLSFMKYSSRFDNVLAGEEPNIFSPEFSGGALMDLGVYLLYAAVSWFGRPESVHYFARRVPTGVDGIGTIILRYETFDVNLLTGKIADSFLPSEIYSLEKTISLNAVNSIEAITIHDRKAKVVKDHPCHKEANPMIEEARAFAKVIKAPLAEDNQVDYRQWLAIGLVVHEIMEELRLSEGITFAADNK